MVVVVVVGAEVVVVVGGRVVELVGGGGTEVLVVCGAVTVATGDWTTFVEAQEVTLSANTVEATNILLRCVTCIT